MSPIKTPPWTRETPKPAAPAASRLRGSGNHLPRRRHTSLLTLPTQKRKVRVSVSLYNPGRTAVWLPGIAPYTGSRLSLVVPGATLMRALF